MPSRILQRVNNASSEDICLDDAERTSVNADQETIHSESLQQPAAETLLEINRRDQIIVIICGFLGVFQTVGPNLSYGVFQDFYSSSNSSPLPVSERSSAGLIAFVGNLAACLTWSGSIVVNPLMTKCRSSFAKITVPGVILMSIGFLSASWCTRTWQLILTQGLIEGVGASLLYFPLLSVGPQYFNSHRGAAMGLVLSAAGVGGLVWSLSVRALLSKIGSAWTLRALALECLIVGLPIAVMGRPSRVPGSARSTLVSSETAKKPAFPILMLGSLLQAAGNFVPLTFTPSFSAVLGYSAGFGASLLAISNGVNTFSRILSGFVADSFGRQNTLIASSIASAVIVVSMWTGAAASSGDQAVWIGFVVAYALVSGGFNALFPVTISEVFGVQAYAAVNGFIYFARGLGALLGSPVAGKILGVSRTAHDAGDQKVLEDYRKLIWYDSSLLIGAALCASAVRGLDAWDKKIWRWRA